MSQATKQGEALLELKTTVLAESDDGKVPPKKKRKAIKVRTKDSLI